MLAPEPPTRRSWSRRHAERRPRRWWIMLGLVGAILVAGDAGMYLAIDGWRAEAADLRASAHASAEAVGEEDAVIASHAALLEILASQDRAARDRAAALEGEVAEKKDVSDAYREAALTYEQCGDERAEAIATPVGGRLRRHADRRRGNGLRGGGGPTGRPGVGRLTWPPDPWPPRTGAR